MKKLTAKEKNKYVKSGYGKCPKCQSVDIEGGSADFDCNEVSQKVRCLECDFAWYDIYTLSGIVEIE